MGKEPWWWNGRNISKAALENLSILQDFILDNMEFNSLHMHLMDEICEVFMPENISK